ncbi:RNA-binding protein [Candidatus Bathyarchaeota archaeon]|nr:RNA-binding protein [Candidatus Bathyarchaeota archaeon]
MVKLAVAIPASVVSDTPHLREKTSKVGLIGRAAAIFRVNEIVVYADNPKVNQRADVDLIATLLEYMETPQYLRKRLFKIEPRLQYAGILPPLRTPHHPLNSKAANLKVGEYREGVVLSEIKEGLLVDVGVEQPALLREKQFVVGKRVTLQIVKAGEHVEVQAVSGEVPGYWGYTVTVERHSLKRLIEDRKFDLTVGTSIKGAKFTGVAGEFAGKWRKADSVLVAFGAPTRGLHEIARDEGVNLVELVDFVVNTIPAQGTETVRTAEALLATLAILNVQFNH